MYYYLGNTVCTFNKIEVNLCILDGGDKWDMIHFCNFFVYRHYRANTAINFFTFKKSPCNRNKKTYRKERTVQKYCCNNITVFQPAVEMVVQLYYLRISSLAISLIVCNRITTFVIQEAHTRH